MSDLAAEGEVAGVADAGDDVAVAGQLFVDCCGPEGYVVGEMLLEILHGVCTGNRADKVGLLRGTSFLNQGIVNQFDGCACSQHRIGEDQGLSGDVGADAVVGAELEIVSLAVFAVGGDKGRLGAVEAVQNTFLEGKAGAQDVQPSGSAADETAETR